MVLSRRGPFYTYVLFIWTSTRDFGSTIFSNQNAITGVSSNIRFCPTENSDASLPLMLTEKDGPIVLLYDTVSLFLILYQVLSYILWDDVSLVTAFPIAINYSLHTLYTHGNKLSITLAMQG